MKSQRASTPEGVVLGREKSDAPVGSGAPVATPKVSVLVPVYNAAPFLKKCMDRLVGQTLRDIEIICINDGSTDESAAILESYTRRDARVRIITKANSGYGDSMNKGVQAARGEWIGICEPDDFASKRMFSQLVEAGEATGVDIVKANYSTHSDEHLFDQKVYALEGLPYGTAFDPRTQPDILLVPPTIWTAIYRRSLVVENGIEFSTTPGASFQDTSFAHQCWVAAKSACLVKAHVYHYRIDNAASSSKSGSKVFEVCGEYRCTFDFLRRREALAPGGLETFGPWLNTVRQGAYLWNYNRISADHHREFVERWIADNEQQASEGLLDESLMTAEFRNIVAELREGAEAFCEKYPDEIPVPPIK